MSKELKAAVNVILRANLRRLFGFEAKGVAVMISGCFELPNGFLDSVGSGTDDPVMDVYLNGLPGADVWPEIVALGGYGLDFELVKECVDRYGPSTVYTTDVHLFASCAQWTTWDDSTIGQANDEGLAMGHQGITWVHEIKRFEWPTLESAAMERKARNENYMGLPLTSFLSENGYSVAKGGPSVETRREILATCIQRFGVSAVTTKLAGFISNSRHPTKRRAHQEWKEDLEWVRRNFYA